MFRQILITILPYFIEISCQSRHCREMYSDVSFIYTQVTQQMYCLNSRLMERFRL